MLAFTNSNFSIFFTEQTEKVDLNRLANNPDELFELLDEIGSDFEIEDDDDVLIGNHVLTRINPPLIKMRIYSCPNMVPN